MKQNQQSQSLSLPKKKKRPIGGEDTRTLTQRTKDNNSIIRYLLEGDDVPTLYVTTQHFGGSIHKSHVKATYARWYPDAVVARQSGAFAVAAMLLSLDEQEFFANVLGVAFDLPLTEPQDIREHDDDLKRIMQAKGSPAHETLQLLSKMLEVGPEEVLLPLMAEGLRLFPLVFASDEPEEVDSNE